MSSKSMITDTWQQLDEPLELPDSVSNIKKKGKLKVVIHYEDYSFKEYFVNLSHDYYILIKKKKYLLMPEAIIRGKQPAIHYYFNNPWPILFKHLRSDLKASEMWSEKIIKQFPEHIQEMLTSVIVDASVLHAATDSDWLKSMYSRPGISAKTLIVIAVVILVVILVILQVTGVVDVVGFFTQSAK